MPVLVVGALTVVVPVVVCVVVPRPLDVYVVRRAHDQVGRVEVVLVRGVRLHDVAALALDVQVDDVCVLRDAERPRLDLQHVGAVLEGAPVLVGVDRQLEQRVGAAAAVEEKVEEAEDVDIGTGGFFDEEEDY